jgi:hypothetical protein
MEGFRVRYGFQNVDQGRTLGRHGERSKDCGRRLYKVSRSLYRSDRLASKMNHYNFEDTIFGFNETNTTPLSLLNFTRGVATTHDVAHLESRCDACGFRLSALDETLDSGEREHATRCAGPTSE